LAADMIAGVQTELLSEEQLAEVREVIKVYDKKGDGQLPASELAIIFQALSCNVSNEEVNEYLKVVCCPCG
jgi:Ca2+-binding EF-hand superfamily protein